MHFSLKALVCLSTATAVAASVVPGTAENKTVARSAGLLPFNNKTAAILPFNNKTAAVQGTPAMYTHVWTGTVKARNVTLYGNSVEDIVTQIHHADPTANTTVLTTHVIEKGLSLAAMDKGEPEDLPDIGEPSTPWKGIGGPYTDYTNSTVTYEYYCGNFATADEAMARKGAKKLRNKPGEIAFVRAHSCSRHWCHDTTAMFVCNDEDEDISIPLYNVGWMAERIHQLCCDDNGGKSGQMFHYKEKYNVVLGYANCRQDAETNQPYPYGQGNNQQCRGASKGIW